MHQNNECKEGSAGRTAFFIYIYPVIMSFLALFYIAAFTLLVHAFFECIDPREYHPRIIIKWHDWISLLVFVIVLIYSVRIINRLDKYSRREKLLFLVASITGVLLFSLIICL